jgi:hypothetical protein
MLAVVDREVQTREGIDPEQVYLFYSEQNAHLLGLTSDPTASPLPGVLGPWRPAVAHAARQLIDSTTDPVSTAIMRAIRTRGFYLSRPDGIAW